MTNTRQVKFVHTTDVRLDGPVRELSSPERTEDRRREFRQAFERIVSFARHRQVDLFIIAGDFLEHQTVRKQTVSWVQDQLATLGCPVFVSPGNHDPVLAGSYYETHWPANVHIFRTEEIEHVTLDERNLVVHGLGWRRYECRDPLLDSFHVPSDGLLHLVVIHGDTFNPESTPYLPIDPARLEQVGADYIALECLDNLGLKYSQLQLNRRGADEEGT